jgi:hypothetical protein
MPLRSRPLVPGTDAIATAEISSITMTWPLNQDGPSVSPNHVCRYGAVPAERRDGDGVRHSDADRADPGGEQFGVDGRHDGCGSGDQDQRQRHGDHQTHALSPTSALSGNADTARPRMQTSRTGSRPTRSEIAPHIGQGRDGDEACGDPCPQGSAGVEAAGTDGVLRGGEPRWLESYRFRTR